jgi:hypothetical protein
MQRISSAPFLDLSLAYFVGAVTVLTFGIAALAVSAGDFNLALDFDDEVKVEAAQFPSETDPDMDIFAAGCNGKSEKKLCKTN